MKIKFLDGIRIRKGEENIERQRNRKQDKMKKERRRREFKRAKVKKWKELPFMGIRTLEKIKKKLKRKEIGKKIKRR